MESNDVGSSLDFGFGFNDINFSDRVLRIEIQGDDEVELRPEKRTKKLCNIESGIEVKSLHINSLIVAARSPFFLKLFSNGMKESEERHATLKIHPSEEAALMELLKFMYSNTVTYSTTSSLLDLLVAADKFQVPSCVKHCTQLLTSLPMTPELALQVLDLPSTLLMAEEVQTLPDAAKRFLVVRYKDFTKSQEEMLKLPLAGIEVLLSSDDLRVASENRVYDFVLKWARKNYPMIEKRREILTTRLASLIRFEYMTYGKLKEIPSCNDFDPAYTSKVVLDALFYKAQSPHLQTIPPRFVERAYLYRPVKVLESKFPHPHSIVYFDLKKEECDNLLPTTEVFSEPFHLGGNWLFLMARRCSVDNNGCSADCFGLFIVRSNKDTGSCLLDCEFSARSKPTSEYFCFWPKTTCSMIEGKNASSGKANLFGVTWSQFIAKDSVYFINGVLYLKVEMTMKS